MLQLYNADHWHAIGLLHFLYRGKLLLTTLLSVQTNQYGRGLGPSLGNHTHHFAHGGTGGDYIVHNPDPPRHRSAHKRAAPAVTVRLFAPAAIRTIDSMHSRQGA